MNRWIRPGLVLTLAAALIGLPASAASAAVPPTVPPMTGPAGCATGAITSSEGRLPLAVVVSGWMLPCAGTAPEAGFAIVHYGPTAGIVTPSQLRDFTSATEPTPFVAVAAEEKYKGQATARMPLAICIAGRDLVPVDCVRVTYPAGRAPVVQPLPTSDPLVRKQVTEYAEDDPGGPGCGNCV